MKKPSPQFLAEIEEGNVKLYNKIAFRAYIQKYVGKKVYLIVKPVNKIRTLNQNAYYWGGVLAPIADHTGYSPEDLHELFKEMFIGRQEVTWRGVKRKIPTTTTTKTTTEFSDYVNKIIVEAGEMGIVILSPDEYLQQFNIDIEH